MKTIALFGATGRTGNHFLRYALDDDDISVRALVRNPRHETLAWHNDALSKSVNGDSDSSSNTSSDSASKRIRDQIRRLTIIEGSMEDPDKVEETVRGSNYVVIMAAATTAAGNHEDDYPHGFMTIFAQQLTSILNKMPQTHRPKLVVYQAGSLSTDGYGNRHVLSSILKSTKYSSMRHKVDDNDAAIQFLTSNSPVSFLITRAGVLVDENDDDDNCGNSNCNNIDKRNSSNCIDIGIGNTHLSHGTVVDRDGNVRKSFQFTSMPTAASASPSPPSSTNGSATEQLENGHAMAEDDSRSESGKRPSSSMATRTTDGDSSGSSSNNNNGSSSSNNNVTVDQRNKDAQKGLETEEDENEYSDDDDDFREYRLGGIFDDTQAHARLSFSMPPMPWMKVTFRSLALLTLDLLDDEALYNTFPYIVPTAPNKQEIGCFI